MRSRRLADRSGCSGWPGRGRRASCRTAAALAALRLLRRDPARPSKARNTARELHARLAAAGLDTPRPEACVLSVLAENADAAVRWAIACRDAGIAVGCFRPPSVPDGISRLRLSARADLMPQDIDRAVNMITRTAPR
ncbi:aminotransferase class I/II-fold pyridoxal phosphate-dependent enzyme [Nonomuraea sp. B10E15]|uniref:aminotransferase class I/II-fold pyridoxal phosphate-dependent enzyme n=1 Tax=Nonomuraea sp. B10E15 TaxID=3153560 RepID=UPI00325F8EB5